jgi:catechol 2,3-dioxygenase-like lactoylglutathione lyase family enzyme
MDIRHLHLNVRDRSVSETFYREWLGLKVDRRGECLTFMTDGSGFDLALMHDSEPAPLPGWFHFGCKLSSSAEVVALHRRMLEHDLPWQRLSSRTNPSHPFGCGIPMATLLKSTGSGPVRRSTEVHDGPQFFVPEWTIGDPNDSCGWHEQGGFAVAA